MESLPHEYFDLKKSDVLDEDVMIEEPGIVFFEVRFFSLHPFFLPFSNTSNAF